MAIGHVLRRAQLGLSPRDLAAAVGRGSLTRVAQGWYATPFADPDAVRAIRLGSRLTCMSAARLHGLWVTRDTRLHVAVRWGDPVFTVPGVVVHRLDSTGWGTLDAVLDLTTCLDQLLAHHPVAEALMTLESAVDRGLLSEPEARELIERRPRRQRGLQHFDPRSGSGSETWVRLWFQRRRVPVRTQVHIAGVGRVDLLVGESLVIEVDSVAHHTSVSQYEEDRRRDLVLTALGFQVIRLSYSQVFGSWPTTVSYLRQILATGRYRHAPIPDAHLHLPDLRRAA